MKTNEMGIAAQALDLTNQRFGSLTYVRPVSRQGTHVMWVAVCDCGRVITLRGSSYKTTKSCSEECPTHCKKSFSMIAHRYTCEEHGEVALKENSTDYRCPICKNARQRLAQHRLKQRAADFLGGCCNRCGYDKCLAAMDFHHVVPSDKSFAIGETVRKWSDIEAELKKCDLLCSNCHREHHYNEE